MRQDHALANPRNASLRASACLPHSLQNFQEVERLIEFVLAISGDAKKTDVEVTVLIWSPVKMPSRRQAIIAMIRAPLFSA
eukprot:SAG11_NODE_16941_length_533_cov_0.824885_1_plen_80_part_10